MLITFEVSKLDKSIDSNPEHLQKIPTILVTCDVLKFDKFIEVNNKQE